VLPSTPALELPSRHLGLHPPHELEDLDARQAEWAALAEQHLDLERLWPLLAPAAPPADPVDPIPWCLQLRGIPERHPRPPKREPLPIAVASDAAFHFRYPEAGELLQHLGVQPIPWSPLADQPLPPGCRGVLLPGGYPELHAGQLAASQRSLAALRSAASLGLPIAAECGGLLLLGQSLHDPLGVPHAMAGLLPFSAARGELSLGYRQTTACADGLLVRQGDTHWGHEFHRWQLQPLLGSREHLWQVDGWGVASRVEGWTAPTVHASWIHLHWAGCPAIPSRLAETCARAAPLPANAAFSSPANPAPTPPVSAGA
jgi:cobyrinic acid a,c-diamide synthase